MKSTLLDESAQRAGLLAGWTKASLCSALLDALVSNGGYAIESL